MSILQKIKVIWQILVFKKIIYLVQEFGLRAQVVVVLVLMGVVAVHLQADLLFLREVQVDQSVFQPVLVRVHLKVGLLGDLQGLVLCHPILCLKVAVQEVLFLQDLWRDLKEK